MYISWIYPKFVSKQYYLHGISFNNETKFLICHILDILTIVLSIVWLSSLELWWLSANTLASLFPHLSRFVYGEFFTVMYEHHVESQK